MSLIDTQSQLKSPAKAVVLDFGPDSQSTMPASVQDCDPIAQHPSRFRRLAPATALGIAWSLFPSIAGVLLLLNMEPIALALIGDTGSTSQLFIGLGVYTVCFIILAGFGFLPTISQAVLAGYTFGFTFGLPAAMIGFAGASLIGYKVVKYLARDRIEHELNRSPKSSMVRHALLTASPKRAILIVTLLRASPSAPFALTNLVLVSLGVSRSVFLIGTILGMLPRTLGAVLIGVSVTNWSGEYSQPRWMIVAGIAATVVLLIVISKVAASTLKNLSTAE
ncbi:MAG: VTT domain-containing protein [Phycisphaerales bacterium]|nr:VTT domain-containing protein [Phycisphaerales bacterium]